MPTDDTTFYDVDLARDVRNSITLNPALADDTIKGKLNSTDIADDDLVLVAKKFNTPTIKIVGIDKITTDFVSTHIKYR
jgi:hypothetical protein